MSVLYYGCKVCMCVWVAVCWCVSAFKVYVCMCAGKRNVALR